MDSEKLNKLKSLYEKSTRGTWVSGCRVLEDSNKYVAIIESTAFAESDTNNRIVVGGYGSVVMCFPHDAEFIAEVHNEMPALLSAAEMGNHWRTQFDLVMQELIRVERVVGYAELEHSSGGTAHTLAQHFDCPMEPFKVPIEHNLSNDKELLDAQRKIFLLELQLRQYGLTYPEANFSVKSPQRQEFYKVVDACRDNPGNSASLAIAIRTVLLQRDALTQEIHDDLLHAVEIIKKHISESMGVELASMLNNMPLEEVG
jgi:hypothetical protein